MAEEWKKSLRKALNQIETNTAQLKLTETKDRSRLNLSDFQIAPTEDKSTRLIVSILENKIDVADFSYETLDQMTAKASKKFFSFFFFACRTDQPIHNHQRHWPLLLRKTLRCTR